MLVISAMCILGGKCSCLEVCAEIGHRLFDVVFCNTFKKIFNIVCSVSL